MQELFHLNDDIRHYDRVMIYGVGEAGKAVLLKLLQRNLRVDCLIDSDPEKCGGRLLNLPVVHIDELPKAAREDAVVVSGRYAFTVVDELEKRGFRHLFLDYGNEVSMIHLNRGE